VVPPFGAVVPPLDGVVVDGAPGRRIRARREDDGDAAGHEQGTGDPAVRRARRRPSGRRTCDAVGAVGASGVAGACVWKSSQAICWSPSGAWMESMDIDEKLGTRVAGSDHRTSISGVTVVRLTGTG
jgi:hypothetical protein